MSWAAAGLASGLAQGFDLAQTRKARKEAAIRDQEALDLRRREVDAMGASTPPFFPDGGGWAGQDGAARGIGGSRGGGSTAPYDVSSDPVAEGLAPQERAFLNAIAGGESGGRYNVRYTPRGGASFESYDQHPGIYEEGPHGRSSAAGRYQFVKSTWDGLGGGAFTPERQDRAALELARRDYRARTGRDFDADLSSQGLTDDMIDALSPTWAALASNRDRHAATYRASLDRYRTPPAPAETASAAPADEKQGWAAIRRAIAS